jgi:hypothetical protein
MLQKINENGDERNALQWDSQNMELQIVTTMNNVEKK